jgi:hypothetical protein
VLENIAPIVLAVVVLSGLAYVAVSLHSQYRMRRHLRRLKTVPLEQWGVRG